MSRGMTTSWVATSDSARLHAGPVIMRSCRATINAGEKGMTEQELREYVFSRFGAECLFCGWNTDADELVLCQHLLATGKPNDYFPVCPSCLEGTKNSGYFEEQVQQDGKEHYYTLDDYPPT